MNIEIDGNDGVGKTTMVQWLEANTSHRIKDRGGMTKATDDPTQTPDPDVAYFLLDADVSTCRTRLEERGADMEEYYHSVEGLTHYAEKFKQVADDFGATVIPSTPLDVYRVLENLEGRSLRVGFPKGRLSCVAEKLGVQFEGRCFRNETFYNLKAADIPQLVALGMLDAGFTGWDLVQESPHDNFKIIHHTGWAPFDFVVAAPSSFKPPKDRPLVIATSYPNIASKHFAERPHVLLHTRGSTEAYLPEFADVLVDITETGTTLKTHGLEVRELIGQGDVVYIASEDDAIHKSLLARL